MRLFYGEPYDLLTVGGYTAWRVGGTLAIFAAVLGLLAAVRALRTEEDAGRDRARARRRRSAAATAYAGRARRDRASASLILWAGATSPAPSLGGLPAGDSAYLALATASVVPVFVGVGALASQLAPTRRIALELGGAVVGARVRCCG